MLLALPIFKMINWEAISDEFELIKVIRVHENHIIEKLQSRRSLNKTEKVTRQHDSRLQAIQPPRLLTNLKNESFPNKTIYSSF